MAGNCPWQPARSATSIMVNISTGPRSVAGRVVRSFGANAYEQAVTVIVQLVGVPVLLYAWGARTYGEWLMLSAIPAYLSIAGLGLCQSASNDMTARAARGDVAAAAGIYRGLFRVIWSIAGTGLVVVAALAITLPVERWFEFSGVTSTQLRWMLWLVAAETLVAQPNGVTHSGFRASGEEAFHVSATCSVRLFQAACMWTVAIAGGGPLAAAIVFFLVRVAGTACWSLVLVRRHRWLVESGRPGEKAGLGRLLKPALANLSLPLGQAVNVQGMVLVIGALLGPLSVVAFSTARTLTRLTVQAVASITNAVEPELARAHGTSDGRLVSSLFLHSVRISFWMGVVAVLALSALGPRFLQLWTHGKVSLDAATFALLLASALASVLWYAGLALLKSDNGHLAASSLYLAGSLAAMGFAYSCLALTHQTWVCSAALLLVDILMAAYVVRAATARTGLPLGEIASFAMNPIPLFSLCKSRLAAASVAD